MAVVWNVEPTEYGDYHGVLTGTGFDVTIEHGRLGWQFYVWSPSGMALMRSPIHYMTADDAKRAIEALVAPPSTEAQGS
jgi:hypothetical protein